MKNHLLLVALLSLLTGGLPVLVRGQTPVPPPATVNLPPPKPTPEFTVQSCSVTSQSVTMNCGGNQCASDAKLQELERKVNFLMAAVSNCCNISDVEENNNTLPCDCKDILDNDEVYCDMVYCDMDTDGGGWTVFQRRQDGTVDFYRGWADYKTGFPSNLNGEFWLGNDKLHRLTEQKAYGLRVDMEDADGNTAYAAYSSFSVSDESDKYRLTVGGYSGDAGDSLSRHSGQQFSTKDSDNDAYAGHCSQKYKGAWWYERCHKSNLNGLYHLGAHSQSYADGVNWRAFKGYYHSLKRTTMKIRP